MTDRAAATDGLVVVDKPAGMTSHDVVARCRGIFGQRRVGHAGTLDPDATGVLLVGLGRATRLMTYLAGLTKSYAGEVVLGVATSTLDASGEVTGAWDMQKTTLEQVQRAAAGLTGTIQQVPPMVSAVKIGGDRLHRLARRGIEVERPSRTVTVSRFSLTWAADQDPGRIGGGPVLRIEVDCSSGTYVRALAADLGARLGGGAHLRRLRRCAVGPWTEQESVPLDEVAPSVVHRPSEVLRGVPTVVATGELAVMVAHGRVLRRVMLGLRGEGPWPVVDEHGELLAVYHPHGPESAKPAVVLTAGVA